MHQRPSSDVEGAGDPGSGVSPPPRSIAGWWVGGTVAVLAASFWFYHYVLFSHVRSDLQHHVKGLINSINGDVEFQPNPLYYMTIYLLSGFRAERVPLWWAAATTLGVATAARFALDFKILSRGPTGNTKAGSALSRSAGPILMALAFALTVAFSLPTLSALKGVWYLGQTPANIWHNSTTIFVMPLSIALFWVSGRNLAQPTGRGDVAIVVLCILNVLAKPSFFLVFAPVYAGMVLLEQGLHRRSLTRIWPLAVAGLFLALQYYLIFRLQVGNLYQGESGVTIAPFEVWSYYSRNIPLSIVASILFPLVYLLMHRDDLRKHLILRYSLLLYVASLAMMSLLSESGPRRYHGNFFWQSYICAHLLFLATATILVDRLKGTAVGVREWCALTALGLHAAFGLVYLGRVLATGRFN